MTGTLFYQPLISSGIHHLDEEESRHCVKVLRKKISEPIKITDGQGAFYDAVITNADPRKCSFQITNSEAVSQRPFSIHIAVSPTKNPDRMEWLVEKMVEFGVDNITLISGKNSER